MKNACIEPKKNIPISSGDPPSEHESEQLNLEITKYIATNKLIIDTKKPNIVMNLIGSFEC